MADEDLPPMHIEFPRWMREFNLGGEDVLQQRWAGVAGVVADPTAQDVEALVRLAFRTRQAAPPAASEKIRAIFRKADAEFEMKGNDRELQVLAAVCLASLFAQETDIASTAALATTTAAVGGARKPTLPMDLAGLAEANLVNLTEATRKRPDLKQHVSVNVPKVDFSAAVAKIAEVPNWEGVKAAFQLSANATQSALATVVHKNADTVRAANEYIKAQDEELQMLWWLVGQRSWDFDCGFDAVPASARPLVFGKELANLTEFLPGPAAVKALLSRAGLREKSRLAIKDAVNNTDAKWLRELVDDDDPSPVTQPIHFAIKRQLETGAGEAWVPGWAAITGVHAEHALTPLALGHLFYRERLQLLFPN